MSTTTPPMGGARPVAPPTTRPLARRVRAWTLGALLVLQFLPGATAPKAQQGAPASPPAPNAAAQATGRVAGRVVDAASGQPLAGVQVMVGSYWFCSSNNRFIKLLPGLYFIRCIN